MCVGGGLIKLVTSSDITQQRRVAHSVEALETFLMNRALPDSGMALSYLIKCMSIRPPCRRMPLLSPLPIVCPLCFPKGLLIFSIIFYVGSLVGIILLYVFFTEVSRHG